MIRPMPFWPSFEPWQKLTPVQVRIRMPRIHSGGGLLPSGAAYSAGLRTLQLQDQQQDRRAAQKPNSGDSSSA